MAKESTVVRYRVGLETRERILGATRSLLSEQGFDGVTLKAISARAGIGAGSFYNLFDSKEAVVLEVAREAIAAVDPDPSGAGTDTVDELVAAFVAFVTRDPMIARIYLQLSVGGGLTDARLGARVLRSHEARVERFGDAMRRAEPELCADEAWAQAEVLLGGLTGLAITCLLDESLDFASQAARLQRAVASRARY